jgi:hypothetical protein
LQQFSAQFLASARTGRKDLFLGYLDFREKATTISENKTAGASRPCGLPYLFRIRGEEGDNQFLFVLKRVKGGGK